MSEIEREIATQPACWEQAVSALPGWSPVLPRQGERVALVGCGTSWFVAQAAAALREGDGQGETDAYTPTEMPAERRYDRVVAISRSGTTTEVLRWLDTARGVARVAITADDDAPIAAAAEHLVALTFADERSVVQTRFATTSLAVFRAHLGENLDAVVAQAGDALAAPLPIDPSAFDHFVFLGHGWTVGLASEAALKLRETAQAHCEAYPAMEYRHGPVSLAGSSTLVWILETPDPAVVEDVRATGATVLTSRLDPMAELVRIQRVAVALAEARGLDPDHPRHLTRSVVLP